MVAHLRFDGLSALRLTEELGRVCGFEPGECRLCWAGAFPSFAVSSHYTPAASWKILDSVAGVVREGTYDAVTLNTDEFKKPRCVRARALDMRFARRWVLPGAAAARKRLPLRSFRSPSMAQ